ncbi:nitroreductase [Desulfatibacillum aliphaticivorans]|uniref:nitroreductase n=1 Tax=Desulfatibacillum aliphaticivorans TaxID=218208 RepID=UPI00040A3A0A|nr:nitroreductase [Desulfatibacillum aliphaticivorans]
MEVKEAIRKRKSIRKFTSQPVSKEDLRSVLELAAWAPSAENTQPWEFFVLGGEVLDKIREANVEKVRSFELPPEEMHYILVERPKGSVYRERQIEIGKALFELMDIPREDKVKRAAWMERGFRYFEAPAAIIIAAEMSLPLQQTFLDVGAVMQNICLAAADKGLYTCIENQGVTYADVVKKHAGIPESKRLVAAIAIGYPDWDFPANKVESQREPIDNVITWCGM